MIGVIDYGAGNLGSVENALRALGMPHRRCADANDLDDVAQILLPGVGHFGAASRALQANGMAATLRAWAGSGRPLFGICLGMQLLFDGSDEAPGVPGLALLPGRCERLRARYVPHLGWNRVQWNTDAVSDAGTFAYFAHSYHVVGARPDDIVATVQLDGASLLAMCRRGRIVGCQFHPEKSGAGGLQLLRRWLSC